MSARRHLRLLSRHLHPNTLASLLALWPLAILVCLAASPGAAQTLVVNSADAVDDGTCDGTHCSVVEAIDECNLAADVCNVTWDTGSDTQITTVLSSELELSDETHLDASTQCPEATTEPCVELDFSAVSGVGPGLAVLADGCSVESIAIIAPSDNDPVEIGVVDGVTFTKVNLGVEQDGVTPNCVGANLNCAYVKGSAVTFTDVVCGGCDYGIWLEDADDFTCDTCYIGTDRTGTEDLGMVPGIEIDGNFDLVVQNSVICNNDPGIYNSGGTATIEDNTFCNNTSGFTEDCSGTISGNTFDSQGSDDLFISDASSCDIEDNTSTNRNGSFVYLDGGTGINIRRNSCDNSGAICIDLAPDDLNSNDDDDADSGDPNELQNHPEVVDVDVFSQSIMLEFEGEPSTTYDIDLFASMQPGLEGSGPGERFLFTEQITTEADGSFSGTIDFPANASFATYEHITATATHPTNGTGEMSPAKAAASFEEVAATAEVDDSGDATGVIATFEAQLDVFGTYDTASVPAELTAALFLANASPNRMFRNDGDDTYTDVAATLGVDDAVETGKGVAAADFDNDGDLDLYLVNEGSANRLYRNDAVSGSSTTPSYTDIAAAAGVDDAGDGESAAWSDFDLDGDVDLFLTNDSSANRLFRNEGNSTFTEIGGQAGTDVDVVDISKAATWGDFDDDGDPDLYVVILNAANKLYRNDGSETFTDIANSASVDDDAANVAAAWGDFDNDLDLDLYVACTAGDGNLLFRNDGSETFTDVGFTAGVDADDDATDIGWADYDQDGDLDLFVSMDLSANVLFQNQGDGTFVDAAASAGVDQSDTWNSIVWFDMDNDGDLDLYVGNGGDTNVLYRNEVSGGNWLSIVLVGQTNNNAIGAHITAETNPTQLQYVDGGSGRLGQMSYPVEFGFGDETTVDQMTIRWPSGLVQTLSNIATNQFLVLAEGLGTPTLIAFGGAGQVNQPAPVLDWNDVFSAFSYTLQYSDDDLFTDPTTVESIPVSQYTLRDLPAAGSTVYWRVKAVDASGEESGYSNSDSFLVVPTFMTWVYVGLAASMLAFVVWRRTRVQLAPIEV